MVSVVAIVIAALAAYPLLGQIDQAFQYIQEYTGFISPGVLAVFMMGLFYKKASANAALWTAILSIPLSTAMKFLTPDLPFISRMEWVFVISVALIVILSWFENKGKDSEKAISLAGVRLGGDPIFTAASFGILGITAVLYAMFW